MARQATVLLVVLAIILGGCASTGPTRSIDASEVLGVWRYRTNGSPHLGDGVIQISHQNGRMQARIRDSRLGYLQADVEVNGNRMRLRMDGLYATGPVEDGHFTGFLRRPQWDVSTSQNYRRQQSPNAGSIMARRVQGTVATTLDIPLGCTDGLVEVDYRCE